MIYHHYDGDTRLHSATKIDCGCITTYRKCKEHDVFEAPQKEPMPEKTLLLEDVLPEMRKGRVAVDIDKWRWRIDEGILESNRPGDADWSRQWGMDCRSFVSAFTLEPEKKRCKLNTMQRGVGTDWCVWCCYITTAGLGSLLEVTDKNRATAIRVATDAARALGYEVDDGEA